MIIEYRDLIAMLHFARTMSSFGPDFSCDLTKKAWHHKLKDLPVESIKRALAGLTGDREFPSVNDIIDFCKDLSQTSELPADQAFDLLWKKIGSVGCYGHPELPNEIGLAAERLGGWKYICNNWTDEKRSWHEKAFREIYGNVTEAKVRGALPTSKYAPPALQAVQAKQIQGRAKEALRMAVSASDPTKPKLKMFLKELKADIRK